ncbi:DUF1656 domain-containing protein [Novosphingobium album (ex Hu et al. 2023)]|uniref:DUF1656 domain-containing protein n=1 Tax=Novosphingobium album (ex Hu et al. 2023) TaxID=2930093 RepID=A0ABT0AVZ1_9SPHN|nr:DUF1656 domain-containing protein [Novosphingobium album (ex Hu et al. 2023)]MCJ2176963.1 DUF1656 domain-containing protein [Novosphingobium album (ex Hu et al. 2023)]
MIPDYLIGNIFMAAAPVDAVIALVLALLAHRLLTVLRAYRWIWHPVLFDTALFVLIWAALVVFVPSPNSGMHP